MNKPNDPNSEEMADQETTIEDELSQSETLGPCCNCEATAGVRNIVSLHKKSPIPGRGWGCLVCGLPMDGAITVLCDGCLAKFHQRGEEPRLACRGYPAHDGRVPIGELTGTHQHDMRKHCDEDQE